MRKISFASTCANVLCWTYLVLTPVMFIAGFVNFEATKQLALGALDIHIHLQTVRDWQWIALLVITPLPALLLWYAVWYLNPIFTAFRRQEFFSLGNISRLKRFGFVLLLEVPVSFVTYAASSVLLTWNHPPGEMALSLKFGSNELQQLFIGFVIALVAWTFEYARRIEDENKAFL